MLSRRHFLAGASAVTAFVLKAKTSLATPRRSPSSSKGDAFDDPTFLALCDTVIPGRESDPEHGPGALEAETPAYLRRVESAGIINLPLGLRLRTIAGAIARLADGVSWASFGKPFSHVSLARRERVLEELVQRVPGGNMMLRLLRAPFYTGSQNSVGFEYLGYPGPNTGYTDYSTGEVTASPHPRTQGGNLP